jgi:putative transposase
LRWIIVIQTQRWLVCHGSSGTGPMYQECVQFLPVQLDEHFLPVARYVEPNALQASLVGRAEDWQCSSLGRCLQDNATKAPG